MATGNYADEEYDAISAARDQAKAQAKAQATGSRRPPARSYFPAANQPSRNTAFARNAPVNTIQQNLGQIPIGGFGLGALSQAGYIRSPQLDMGSFLNQGATNQQPAMTGYKWNAGTGGVSGGNNDLTRQFYSDGTTRSFTGGVEDNKPLSPTQYTLPGVNADIRALSDPSVNALAGAQRSTNQYGQQVVNPVGGGQIISGAGPSFGSLYGSTQSTNAQGQTVLNTPSGGQAIGGPSLRKPQKMSTGQNWSLGGWY